MGLFDIFRKKQELQVVNKLNCDITSINKAEMQELLRLGEYTKIDMNNNMAHINSLLQLVPAAGAIAMKNSQSLSDLGTLFRFVAPEGLEGIQPMQYKNGLSSSITRDGHLFGKHGGYEVVDIENVNTQVSPANIAFVTFSVMSFITGQYFMKQNNDKLREIKEDIGEIKAQLDNDMLSEIEATYNFLSDAVAHQNDNNALLQQAYLSNIVASKVKLDKYMAMTRNEIERLEQKISNKDKYDEVSANGDKYIRLVNRYQLIADCYMVACVLEVTFSGYFKSTFIVRQRGDVELKIKECQDIINNSYMKIEEYYQNAKGMQYSLADHIFNGSWRKAHYIDENKAHIESNLGKVIEQINAVEYNQKLMKYVDVLTTLDKFHNKALDMIVDKECIYLRN